MKVKQIVSLLEGFKEAQIEFSNHADPTQVKTHLDQYKEIVKQNKAVGDERNIDYWRKRGFEEFSKFVNTASQKVSSREVKNQRKATGKSHIVQEDSKWLIVIPLDKDSSCFHGKDTKWCTTKPYANYYEQYFYKNNVTLIYCLNKETGDKWAIAHYTLTGRDAEQFGSERDEFFNKNDTKTSQERFERSTGLNAVEIINKAVGNAESDIFSAREEFKTVYSRLTQNIEDHVESPEVERDLMYVKHIRLFKLYCEYAKNPSAALIKMYMGLIFNNSEDVHDLIRNYTDFCKFGTIDDSTKQKLAGAVMKKATSENKLYDVLRLTNDKCRLYMHSYLKADPSLLLLSVDNGSFGKNGLYFLEDIVLENYDIATKLVDRGYIKLYHLPPETLHSEFIDYYLEHTEDLETALYFVAMQAPKLADLDKFKQIIDAGEFEEGYYSELATIVKRRLAKEQNESVDRIIKLAGVPNGH